MKKIYCLMLMFLILLGFALPTMASDHAAAVADSLTIMAPYAVVGCYGVDYEHSLNETSTLNVTGMYIGDGIIKAILKAMFGIDSDYAALDGAYKYYPGGAQNGFYYGADLMISTAISNSSTQSFFYQPGVNLGFRKIMDGGLTFDLGAVVYYSFTEQTFNPLYRVNIGFGW